MIIKKKKLKKDYGYCNDRASDPIWHNVIHIDSMLKLEGSSSSYLIYFSHRKTMIKVGKEKKTTTHIHKKSVIFKKGWEPATTRNAP